MTLFRAFFWLVIAVMVLLGVSYGNEWLRTYYITKRLIQDDNTSALLERPFVTVDGTTPVSALRPRQSFFVHYHIRRARTCSFDYTTYVMSQGEPRLAVALKTVSSWLLEGEYTVNEMYEVPALPAGAYRITKKFVHHCGNDTFYTVGFDIPFVIEAPE